MKYAFIRSHCREHKVIRLCQVLEVSTSGYYDWLCRPESARSGENRRLTVKIRQCHLASGRRYGSPRIYQDLHDAGECCSEKRVARLMRQHDIQAKMARRFMVTTDRKSVV